MGCTHLGTGVLLSVPLRADSATPLLGVPSLQQLSRRALMPRLPARSPRLSSCPVAQTTGDSNENTQLQCAHTGSGLVEGYCGQVREGVLRPLMREGSLADRWHHRGQSNGEWALPVL